MTTQDKENALLEIPLECEEKFHGILNQVDHLKVQLPNGKTSMREIVRHCRAAAVIPVDDEGNVYMVWQYRVAIGRVMLEIPAGKLDNPDEDPREAAIRELEEETGLRAENIEELNQLISSPGFCTEIVGLYLATGLSQHETHPDADEFLHVEKFPLKEMVQRVMSGEISDAKTVAGILMASQRLEHVQK